MNRNKPFYIGLLIGCVGLFVLILIGMTQESYGSGYDNDGLVIHKHFTIQERDVLWTDYKPCKSEDSLSCYWNGKTRGNHRGKSFLVNSRGHYWFVTSRSLSPSDWV